MAATAVVINSSTGTGSSVSFTSGGFGTPTAAVLFISGATTSNADTDHAVHSTVFWDGTNTRCLANASEDNQSRSDVYASGQNSVYVLSGNGAYTVYLLQGAVEIASWVENDAELTTHQRLLSGAQADSITDYSDLNVQVVSGS